jgi:hypothetical protein
LGSGDYTPGWYQNGSLRAYTYPPSAPKLGQVPAGYCANPRSRGYGALVSGFGGTSISVACNGDTGWYATASVGLAYSFYFDVVNDPESGTFCRQAGPVDTSSQYRLYARLSVAEDGLPRDGQIAGWQEYSRDGFDCCNTLSPYARGERCFSVQVPSNFFPGTLKTVTGCLADGQVTPYLPMPLFRIERL